MFLAGDIFIPKRTLVNVWKHFWSSTAVRVPLESSELKVVLTSLRCAGQPTPNPVPWHNTSSCGEKSSHRRKHSCNKAGGKKWEVAWGKTVFPFGRVTQDHQAEFQQALRGTQMPGSASRADGPWNPAVSSFPLHFWWGMVVACVWQLAAIYPLC